MQQVTLQILI